MDTTEIKERREALAESLREQFAEFEKETGMQISNVTATAQRAAGQQQSKSFAVRINLAMHDE